MSTVKTVLIDFTAILSLLSLPAVFVFAGFKFYRFIVTAALPYSFTGVISFYVMLSLLCAIILWVGFYYLINRAENRVLYTLTTKNKETNK